MGQNNCDCVPDFIPRDSTASPVFGASYNTARPPAPFPMQALVWIVRLLVVLVLVWFAVKNAQPVMVNGLPDQSWQAPLVFVLFVAFVAGMVIGLLAWIPTVVRQRRELTRLRRLEEQRAAMPLPSDTGTGTDVHGI
jgi:lipopolysaccharide assembly protein A